MGYDTSKTYIKYALDVINGNIVSCKSIYDVCKRFLSWFEMDDRYFDYEDVDKKIRFVGKLKHYTGKHNGKNFILLPWQQFAFAGIFGWKYKDTKLRITRNAFIFIVRKNGKSALAAALSLACLLVDKEPGAEVDIVANSSKQANILFDMCKSYTESIDPNNLIFLRYRSDIKVPLTKSIIQVHSADSMTLDGFNCSTGIFDEIHAAKDWSLYNVLQSSQGMREQPLMLCITTAGTLVGDEYPCYSMYTTYKRILSGEIENDSVFPLIYELDKDDDWKDESKWIKCCPSLGETVTLDYMRGQVKAAQDNPSLEAGVKTKNFNCFLTSSETWIPIERAREVIHHVDLNQFDKDNTYSIGGLDLSEVDDLTVYSLLIVDKDDNLYVKSYPFIPKVALDKSPNANLYKKWIKDGYLTLIDNEVIDNSIIVQKIIELSNEIDLAMVAYDAWRCKQLKIQLEHEGIPTAPVSQGIAKFTSPTLEFTKRIYNKEITIDDNPVILWCLMNCVLKYDNNNNCKPVKYTKPNKIDCIITILQALEEYMEIKGLISNEDLVATAL